jgi:hypothetical protein
MRRLTTPLIVLAAIIAVVTGWRIFAHDEAARYTAAQKVLHAKSVLGIHYRVAYLHGPLSFEEYKIRNVDGVGSIAYSASDRRGDKAIFTTSVPGFDITVLFEQLEQDGVWQLTSRKPAGNTEIGYAVAVDQTVDNQSGRHGFDFTDPHYWAVNAGRVYHINLANGKVPSQADLVNMRSTQLAEPRFAKIVADLNAFSPPGFRATVARAKAKLRGT